MQRLSPLVLAVAAVVLARPVAAADLRGSSRSMERQHGVAVELDYAFSRTASQVQAQVDAGQLVAVAGGADFALSDVSYPYARPEVKVFIERLAAQYRAATGERMVVTSLVRPVGEQPTNASTLSVHPAGMAVDLRVPSKPSTRRWLEAALLELENAGVLDVTRERRPPHFHVALFPRAYATYVERLAAAEPVVATPTVAPVVPPAARVVAEDVPTAPPASHAVAAMFTLLAAAVVGGATRYRTAGR